MAQYNLSNIKKARTVFLFLSVFSLLFSHVLVFKAYQPESFYKHESAVLDYKTVVSNSQGGGRWRDRPSFFVDLKFKDKGQIYGIYLGTESEARTKRFLEDIEEEVLYELTLDRFLIPRFDGRNMGIIEMRKSGELIFKEDLFENLFRAKVMLYISLFFGVFFVWMHFLYKSINKNV
jgi:hypothetical protein